MADTGFFPYDDPTLHTRVAQVARYRWPADRVPRDNADAFFPPEIRVPNPSGGLWSSARDLVTFGRACLRLLRTNDAAGAPFARASLQPMLRSQTEGLPAHDARNGTAAPPKGLGWDLPGQDPAERAIWSPTAFGLGGSSGTLLVINPEQDLVVAVLGSCANGMQRKRDLAHAAVQASRGH